jgi:hypothetical protein
LARNPGHLKDAKRFVTLIDDGVFHAGIARLGRYRAGQAFIERIKAALHHGDECQSAKARDEEQSTTFEP